MKKNYFLTLKKVAILLCFFNLSNAFAQIIHTENFDNTATNALPTGWSAVGTAANFSVSTSLGTGITALPHSGTKILRMRINGGTSPATESVSTPVFSLEGVGTNTATVSFWIFRDSLLQTNYDSLNVMINTQQSLTGAQSLGLIARCRAISIPDVQNVNGWYQYSFNIPASYTGATNYIIFKSTVYGTTNNSRRICLDDISWDEYPPLCTGTPTAGTLSSPDTLICGGSGTSAIDMTGASTGTGITYQWYTAPTTTGPWTTFGTSTTSVTTDILTSSQYVYSVVTCVSSGLTANSDTLSIVVNPNAIPVVSIFAANDTICRNDTLNLVASGATTYLWSSQANPSLSTADNVDVAPTNNTTYTLVGTDAIGCTSAPVSFTVIVGRRPTITNFTNSNPTVCAGGSSTITINAFGGPGVTLAYEWIPTGETTNAITVTPTQTTLYTVNVIGQYGCFVTDTSTVFVDPTLVSPIVSLSPDTLNICQGTTGTTDLVASSNVAAITYTWAASAGGPIASVNDTLTVNYPTNQSITYTVTGTDPSNGCKSTATTMLLVRPNPTLNLATQTPVICANGDAVINLTIGNTGNVPVSDFTINWTPTGDVGTSITVSPDSTSFFAVTVVSPYGCSRADSIQITVDTTQQSPTVTITPSVVNLCQDALTSVELIASTDASPATFAWTPQNVGSTNDTVVVNPTTTTVYTVVVTNAFGCKSSALSTVNVNAAPVASFTDSIGINGEVFFTSTATNATMYSWDFGDGSTSNLANPSHTYATVGTFQVVLNVMNDAGCSDSVTVAVLNVIEGVDEVSMNSEIQLFPNPASSDLNVALYTSSNASIEIVNLLGEVVSKKIIAGSTEKVTEKLNISNLPSGVYLIHIASNEADYVSRFVKK